MTVAAAPMTVAAALVYCIEVATVIEVAGTWRLAMAVPTRIL